MQRQALLSGFQGKKYKLEALEAKNEIKYGHWMCVVSLKKT